MVAAQVLTSPRISGGAMSQSERGCAVYDTAALRSKRTPAPGKYDCCDVEVHKPTLSFNASRTESRSPKKTPAPAPGQYNLNHDQTEPRVPCYSSKKEDSKSFIDDIQKQKAKMPAPGYAGVPESKVVDR